MLQRLADHFGVPRDYFYPPDTRVTAGAREWLRQVRQMSFDGAPTIATNADVEVDEETKARFAERLKQLRQRLEAKD
jgi:hypothetical protein